MGTLSAGSPGTSGSRFDITSVEPVFTNSRLAIESTAIPQPLTTSPTVNIHITIKWILLFNLNEPLQTQQNEELIMLYY